MLGYVRREYTLLSLLFTCIFTDHLNSYKPDVRVDFVTEELSFVDDQQCAQFLYDYGGEKLLEQKPDGVRLASGKAGLLFENAKIQAFRGVDIKGQI